jgi:hypothetical protein
VSGNVMLCGSVFVAVFIYLWTMFVQSGKHLNGY